MVWPRRYPQSRQVQNRASKEVGVRTNIKKCFQLNLEYTYKRQLDNRKLYNCPTYRGRERIPQYSRKQIERSKKDLEPRTLDSAEVNFDGAHKFLRNYFTYEEFRIAFLSEVTIIAYANCANRISNVFTSTPFPPTAPLTVGHIHNSINRWSVSKINRFI